MKLLIDMDELELRALTTEVLDSLKDVLPDETCFTVLFWPFGQPDVGQYGSNAARPEMIQALREVADRLERRMDVPR